MPKPFIFDMGAHSHTFMNDWRWITDPTMRQDVRFSETAQTILDRFNFKVSSIVTIVEGKVISISKVSEGAVDSNSI